jgi:aspartate aminotransferase
LALTAKIKALQAKGEDIINFCSGQPDFDTPEIVKNKAKEYIDKGYTKYAPTGGIPKLKETIANSYNNLLKNVNYSASEVIITAGVKEALFLGLYVLCNPGDEVLIPIPYWVTYPEQVKLIGGVCKFLKPDENFEPDIKDLLKNISSRTKVLILNTPNNPTGKVYSKEVLEYIADICLSQDIYIIFDEIYNKLVYDDFLHYNIVELRKELKDKVIIVNGVSKSFAMTGWRIGYALASLDIIEEMKKVQSHITSHPVTFCQYAQKSPSPKLSHSLKQCLMSSIKEGFI